MNYPKSVLFFLIFAICTPSCSKNNGSDGPVACGDEKTFHEPIINGTAVWDPSVITLTNAQALSVGFLELGGRGGCTGTLIAPRVVLTAAHCVFSRPSYIRFYTGGNYYTPEGVYTAASYQAHPYYAGRYVDYDVGIVVLNEDPTLDGVEPIPVHLEPPQSLAGQMVVAVGYGITRPHTGGNSRKWWTVLQVVMESPTIYTTSGGGITSPCQGDSGGPLLWDDPVLGARVYGPVSSVESYDCDGLSFYVRSSNPDNAAFIRSYLPEDPCDGETFEGHCDSGMAVWCEGGMVVTDMCETWETCQDDGTGLFRCVVTDNCRGETWEGRCLDDGTAIWCEDGNVMGHECPSFGYTCRMNDEGLHRCMEPGPCDAEGLDWNGICTADGHARWCEDGEIKDRDCWLCDQDCGPAGVMGNYCIDRV